ncbi:MAG: hypothetical protein WC384_19625 [Prolixibacteraceae bacterium]|jgi:hypothetical protein
MKQTFIYTALPNGRITKDGTDYLRISMHCAMRLSHTSATTLGQFPEIMGWAAKLKSAPGFKVRINNSQVVDAVANTDAIDPSVWETMLHNDIKVSAFIVEGNSKRIIHAYPVAEINNSILNVYKEFGIKSPTRFVKADVMLQNPVWKSAGKYIIDQKVVNAVGNISAQNVRKATIRSDFRKLNVTRQNIIQRNADQTQIRDLGQMMRAKNFSNLKTLNKEPEFQFARFRDFHRVDREKKPVFKVPELPEFEFHDIIAQLGDYPQVQRKTGIVVDLLVPFDSSLPKEGTIAAFPFGLEFTMDSEISVNASAYRITSDGFFAREKSGSDVKNGFVRLNNGEFSVTQIDTDGAAMQTINHADNQIQVVANRTLRFKSAFSAMSADDEEVDDEDDQVTHAEDTKGEGLPVIRSSGIAIVKNNIDEYLDIKFTLAKQLNSQLETIGAVPEQKRVQNFQALGYQTATVNTNIKIMIPEANVLYADDLVMGYRMDVAYSDNPDRWYSLHYKQDEVVCYDENQDPFPVLDIAPDEGYCQVAMTSDPENEEDVFVSGVIARWAGWSLAVERPGFAINEDDGVKGKDFVNDDVSVEQKKYAYNPAANVRLNVQSKLVPGTLPVLRYGKTYNIRMRTVDLAGNSVPLDASPENPNEALISDFTYQRYEPVTTPVVFQANKMKIGEDIERLVIKSNFDVPVDDYSEPDVSQKDKIAQRIFMPPQNSQLTAELHGKLDSAFRNDPVAAKQIYDLITSHETPPRAGEPQDKVYAGDEISIRYLPDPAAAGVAFFLDDDSDETHTQVFSPQSIGFAKLKSGMDESEKMDAWLNPNPVTFRLEEGPINAKWSESSRTLTFFLPKGHRAKLRYSSIWNEDDLDKLSGIWKQLSKENNFNSVRSKLNQGKHWMTSPSRELELVHALQQPFIVPELMDLAPERGYDDTPAWIKMKIKVHGQSTEKIDLEAIWKDLDDNPLKPVPVEIPSRKILDPITIKYNESVKYIGLTPPKNPDFRVINTVFLDTNSVNMRMKPNTKITRAQVNANVRRMNLQTQNLQPNNLRTMTLLPKFSLAYVLKAFGVKHLFDDTRHRFVEYTPTATSRYAEFFRQKTTDGGLILPENLEVTRIGNPVKVNILSSARPHKPEVEYIIPTFNWLKSADKDSLTHIREGGGLRIYLKRPWFSSGEGEMLGVVVNPQAATAKNLNNNDPVMFTQWGTDPIFPLPGGTDLYLDSSYFRWFAKTENGLNYSGGNNLKANVIGYPVHFDAERKLWYADLSIGPKNRYFPFVKLMLTRYQPDSLRISDTDVCLSNVVETDFIQLIPERKVKLEVIRRGGKAVQIRIEITGYKYDQFLNSFEIKIISEDLPQPYSGVISTAVAQRGSRNQEARMNSITFPDDSHFVATGYFEISSDIKKKPFDVLVLENEKPDVKGQTRLVFADEFHINKKEDD